MFNSIRWRLQIWHAVLLLIVVTSFAAIVHRLNWQTRLHQVDAELHRTVNTVTANLRKLVPWPNRRPRSSENSKPESESPSRSESPGTPVASDAMRPQNEAGDANRSANSPPRDRPFRDPGPLPAAFGQLFHGDEDTRFYFAIWGRDGELLHSSEFAPALAYPDWHDEKDGVRLRRVRERSDGDHRFREVTMSIPTPRPMGESDERRQDESPI